MAPITRSQSRFASTASTATASVKYKDLVDSRRRAVAAIMIIVAACSSLAFINAEQRRFDPEPYHTSRLRGHVWVQELLNGHRDRMKDCLGIWPYAFRYLEKELIRQGGLQPRRHVGTTEMLAIFLYQAVSNDSVRRTGERFQRSNETVTVSFHLVLNAITSTGFRTAYMKLPTGSETPSRIRCEPKLYPFFKDCVGAIDGSHFFVNPPSLTKGRWRDREGNLTQNVLAAVDFDMRFIFLMSGFEGSAADGSVYKHAVRHGALVLPEGKYLLGDAGFGGVYGLAVPFRQTRYHLREWQIGNRRPQTKEELYNLRHASARNIIERSFGVLKKEFKMASQASEYNIQTQCLIPLALALLHNFYLTYDRDRSRDQLHITHDQEIRHAVQPHGDQEPPPDMELDESEDDFVDARRQAIANAMWTQYQQELARRRTAHPW